MPLDGEITVNDFDRDFFVVLMVYGEIIGFQSHVVGFNICSLCYRIVAIFEFNRNSIICHIKRKAAYRLLLAVVPYLFMIADNLNSNSFGRNNLHLAEGVLDTIVFGYIFLAGHYLCVAGEFAGVIAGILAGKQIADSAYFMTRYQSGVISWRNRPPVRKAMCLSIVGYRFAALTFDGQRTLSDSEAAVFYNKRNVFKVAIVVYEAIRSQSHRIRSITCIRTGCLGLDTYFETKVCIFIIDVRYAYNSVALYRLLSTIVYLGVSVAGDRYNDCVNRGDCEGSLYGVCYDVLSGCICFANSLTNKVDVIFANFLAGAGSVYALKVNARQFEVFAVIGFHNNIISGINRLLLSVISNDSVFGGESYILIVVECNLIGAGSDRYCLAISGNRGVAGDSCRFFGNYCVKRLAFNYFVFCDLIIRSVPIVVYGVAEVGAQSPRAGEGDFFARHGEAAIAANGYVRC